MASYITLPASRINTLFRSRLPAMCKHTLYTPKHQLSQNHCNNNFDDAKFRNLLFHFENQDSCTLKIFVSIGTLVMRVATT